MGPAQLAFSANLTYPGWTLNPFDLSVIHTQLASESQWEQFQRHFSSCCVCVTRLQHTHQRFKTCIKNIFHFTYFNRDISHCITESEFLRESGSWYTRFAAHLSLNKRCLCQIVYLWPRILARHRQSLSHTVLLCLTYWLWARPTWLFSSVSGTMAASTVLIYDQVWWRGS